MTFTITTEFVTCCVLEHKTDMPLLFCILAGTPCRGRRSNFFFRTPRAVSLTVGSISFFAVHNPHQDRISTPSAEVLFI